MSTIFNHFQPIFNPFSTIFNQNEPKKSGSWFTFVVKNGFLNEHIILFLSQDNNHIKERERDIEEDE